MTFYVAGFPHVISCIDGTNVPITAPSLNGGGYVNRKQRWGLESVTFTDLRLFLAHEHRRAI